MRKTYIIPFTILLFFFVTLDGQANNKSENFEKSFFDIGYKEVYQALHDGEKHFKRTPSLPTQLPPIAFTHNFGRLSNLAGKENDEIEVTFIHKDIPQNHYIIRVKPVEYRLELEEDHIDQRFKLRKGHEALFVSSKILGFNLLVFETDGWQYILSVDKRISRDITSEVLVDIANSVY